MVWSCVNNFAVACWNLLPPVIGTIGKFVNVTSHHNAFVLAVLACSGVIVDVRDRLGRAVHA